jgi:hypothetical protein
MTFDSWTSEPGDPFLSVTAHYIDSPADKPQEWELKTEQLAFRLIKGNHSGANIGGILIEVIDKYDIRKKVSIYYLCCCTYCFSNRLIIGRLVHCRQRHEQRHSNSNRRNRD